MIKQITRMGSVQYLAGFGKQQIYRLYCPVAKNWGIAVKL